MKDKYCPEIVDKIIDIILDGGTEKSAYEMVGIGHTSYGNWKNKYPDFARRVEQAKKEFKESLPARLEASLWKVAEGYTVEEKETAYGYDKNGEKHIRVVKEKTKEYQPNVQALIFALTNLSPDKWKNKQHSEIDANVRDIEAYDREFVKDLPEDVILEAADIISAAKKKKDQSTK